MKAKERVEQQIKNIDEIAKEIVEREAIGVSKYSFNYLFKPFLT